MQGWPRYPPPLGPSALGWELLQSQLPGTVPCRNFCCSTHMWSEHLDLSARLQPGIRSPEGCSPPPCHSSPAVFLGGFGGGCSFLLSLPLSPGEFAPWPKGLGKCLDVQGASWLDVQPGAKDHPLCLLASPSQELEESSRMPVGAVWDARSGR